MRAAFLFVAKLHKVRRVRHIARYGHHGLHGIRAVVYVGEPRKTRHINWITGIYILWSNFEIDS
jgi:hypothetical protein